MLVHAGIIVGVSSADLRSEYGFGFE